MIKVLLIHYNLLIQYQFLILHISFLINYIQFNSQGCGLYMKESVRKLGLIGAGLWAMTEDRVNELVKDLVDRGDISKEEGKRTVQDLVEESRKQRLDLEKKISDKMQDAIAKADVFTRKDMNELEARLETLEDEVRKMKNKEKMFFK
jgi:polyhydroxyalkanoate synthesis regulator phasin